MTTTTTSPMTLGEARVRKSFNPSNNDVVDQIKTLAAELIDLCNQRRETASGRGIGSGEEQRCWALAMTEFEDGAMWAVKAATFEQMN